LDVTTSAGVAVPIGSLITVSESVIYAALNPNAAIKASQKYDAPYIIGDAGGGDSYFGVFIHTSTTLPLVFTGIYGWDGNSDFAQDPIPLGAPYSLEATHAAGELTFKTSNSNFEPSTDPCGDIEDVSGNTLIGGNRLFGANRPYDGDIYEIIVYNADFDQTVKDVLNDNIVSFYVTQNTLRRRDRLDINF
jgi:hypothetical protein